MNQVAGPQSTPQNSCTVTPPEESKASVQHVPQPSKSEVVGSLRSWVPPLPFADREHRQAPCDDELENHSRKSAVSGPDEEATVFPSTRMLQDSTGRLRRSPPASPLLATFDTLTMRDSLSWGFCNLVISPADPDDRGRYSWAIRLHGGSVETSDYGEHRLPPAQCPASTPFAARPTDFCCIGGLLFHKRTGP